MNVLMADVPVEVPSTIKTTCITHDVNTSLVLER